MEADLANTTADTRYKHRAADLEPWKLVVTGIGAGAALMAAAVALSTLILSRILH